jgi:AmmeMemoRadiSam system protein B
MTGVVFGCITPHPPLIVPGIGNDADKKPVSSTISALENLTESLAVSRPDAVLIISPHSYYTETMNMTVSLSDTSEGSLHEWGTTVPGLHFLNDKALAQEIMAQSVERELLVRPIVQKHYNLDHGILVPLHFLSRAMKGLPLLPVSFSYLPLPSHFAFGKAIQDAALKLEKRVAVIASGDLSHYLKGSHDGFHPEGEVFEKQLEQALQGMDSAAVLNMDREMVERAGECGLRSIVILLGALDGLKVKAKILSHEGPYGVGYMVASFIVKGE